VVDQLGVNLTLTNPAGYQQTVLGAEVDNNNCLTSAGSFCFGSGRRLRTTHLLGNLKVSGDLDIAGGGYSPVTLCGIFYTVFIHKPGLRFSKITIVVTRRQIEKSACHQKTTHPPAAGL